MDEFLKVSQDNNIALFPMKVEMKYLSKDDILDLNFRPNKNVLKNKDLSKKLLINPDIEKT